MKKNKKKTPSKKQNKKKVNKLFYFIPVATLVMIGIVLAIFLFKNDRVGDCGNIEKQGIDVSHHQGDIDWKRVAESKDIKFAYIKATEGATHRDTKHAQNVNKARENGIMVGSYHYYHPQVSVREQFANFTHMVDISSQDILPVIDIEETGRKSQKEICDSLSKFVRMLTQHYGVEPIIYTNQSFYNKYLKDKFASHKLWIARYGILKLKMMPRLNNGQEWLLWQYSNRGQVKGINGDVDLNTLHGRIELADIKIKRDK